MNEIKKIMALHDNLIRTKMEKFPKEGTVKVTSEHGVYIIFSPGNKVLHIGKTSRGKNGLNQRLQNHLNNKSSFSINYLKKNAKILRKGYKFQIYRS